MSQQGQQQEGQQQQQGQGQEQGQQQRQEGQQQQGQQATWETWHGSLSDEQKGLIESHVSGLKSALQSERQTKGDLEKQVRTLASQAQEGSQAKTELTKLADQLKGESQRADFYESAHGAGIRNLKAAWLIARGDESVWKRDGSLDIAAFKQSYPELFGSVQAPPGNGGNGNGQSGGGSLTMDQVIRQAAGRH